MCHYSICPLGNCGPRVISFTQSSVWTCALTASSFCLNVSTMLLLGSLEVLWSGESTLRPPFLGSLKKSVNSMLHLLVSSAAGATTNGKLVFAFLSEMKISFSWASAVVALGQQSLDPPVF